MWPEGIRSAVALTVDLDGETPWTVKDPNIATQPSALSMAQYGPRVGVPLILSLFGEMAVESTFFIPGRSAEDYPETVESIAAAGHEIAVHGYTHTPPFTLTRHEEEAELVRALDVLGRFSESVSGYRAPVYGVSVHTLELLAKHGVAYSSNFMDDIKPYRHAGSGVVELPVQWIMDDWTQFVHGSDDWLAQNATSAHVMELWMEEFRAIHQLGGLFVLTLHPQVIGRPSRVRMLAELISEMRALEGVWIAQCGTIAQHVSSELA
jgi:peptidoglycan/xylan/chitin deacetylase (PgdA/CDA1 family)